MDESKKPGIICLNSVASVQYMIDKFNIKLLILIGTCGGIDKSNNILDNYIPKVFKNMNK